MSAQNLTSEKLKAIEAVRDGADIYSYSLARSLREIERDHPGLIEIGKPMAYQGDGTDRVPYFGCIATRAGVAALESAS